MFGFVVVMDPYSSGQFTLHDRVDIAEHNALYANVGRVRDPQFNAALFGNSHVQRIEPARLDEATGRRFVMLGMSGTTPSEHQFMMRNFDRLHRGESPALVLVLDDLSCNRIERPTHILPRWLYEGSNAEYLMRILSPTAVISSFRRLAILLGLGHEVGRADGFTAPWLAANFTRGKLDMLSAARPTEDAGADEPFPVLDGLAGTLDQLDRSDAVLLVFSPVFRSMLPVPGSRADARLAACKKRVGIIAAGRPNTDVMDFRVDDETAADPDNFFNSTHYNDDIARTLADKIGGRLAPMLGKNQSSR